MLNFVMANLAKQELQLVCLELLPGENMTLKTHGRTIKVCKVVSEVAESHRGLG